MIRDMQLDKQQGEGRRRQLIDRTKCNGGKNDLFLLELVS